MAKRAQPRIEKPMEAIEHEELLRKCPDCGSTEVNHDNGEYFCAKCGLVLE